MNKGKKYSRKHKNRLMPKDVINENLNNEAFQYDLDTYIAIHTATKKALVVLSIALILVLILFLYLLFQYIILYVKCLIISNLYTLQMLDIEYYIHLILN